MDEFRHYRLHGTPGRKEQGGQRWFHMYPKENIRAGDELHWTGLAQNWNFECAECHSTDLKKNYDTTSNSFKTTWSEINVSCEACHGEGSAHVNWAKKQPPGVLQPRRERTMACLYISLIAKMFTGRWTTLPGIRSGRDRGKTPMNWKCAGDATRDEAKSAKTMFPGMHSLTPSPYPAGEQDVYGGWPDAGRGVQLRFISTKQNVP